MKLNEVLDIEDAEDFLQELKKIRDRYSRDRALLKPITHLDRAIWAADQIVEKAKKGSR